MGLSDQDAAEYLQTAPGYVDAMYDGPKVGLRSIHNALEELAFSLGRDIRLCPGKTIVPVYRRHVIAQIKPSTRTRIDFGLALGNMKGKGRLVETGGFARNDRITHRIGVQSLADIDAELKEWLRRAYERDG